MQRIHYERSQEVPVVAEADVAVLGGGPGGIGAAVMAARAGAKTVLVERYGVLGGMAAVGEVQPFMANHTSAGSLDRPVYLEWGARIHSYLSPATREKLGNPARMSDGKSRIIPKDVASLAAEDLCLEAGVRLLYHHQFADVVKADRRIEAVVLHSKSGLVALKAKCFVDTTGDADVAARAGCRFEMGGPSGPCQPMTLCFKVIGIDLQKAQPWTEVNRLFAEAKASGELDCPRDDVLAFLCHHPGMLHFNTTRVLAKDATDGVALSEAEIEGRRQLRQLLRWMRHRLAGYENVELLSMGSHIGVRESRRIRGLAYLRREDFVAAHKSPDGIARVHYNIDIHNPTGGGTELVSLPANEYYEIPYGCVVPVDCDNLTVGGRPISVDHAVHSSMRVMPCACSVGQAAGIGAAMSAAAGKPPAALEGREVRRRLQEMGAYL